METEIEEKEAAGALGETGGTGRISETLPLEMIEGAEDETSRIEETLALEPMEEVYES